MKDEIFTIKSLNGFHSNYNDVDYYVVEYENNSKPLIVVSYMVRLDRMVSDNGRIPNIGQIDYLNEYFEKYQK